VVTTLILFLNACIGLQESPALSTVNETQRHILEEYTLYRVVNADADRQFDTISRCKATHFIEQYNLLSGDVENRFRVSFSEKTSLSAVSRWHDVSYLIRNAPAKHRATVQSLVPSAVEQQAPSGCELALLAVSPDGQYGIWGIACWLVPPDCYYTIECFLVKNADKSVIARRRICSVAHAANIAGFLNGSSVRAYVAGRMSDDDTPKMYVATEDGNWSVLTRFSGETVAVSPLGNRVLSVKRSDSATTALIELSEGNLEKTYWTRRLPLQDVSISSSISVFWSADAEIVALDVERYPKKRNHLSLIRASDGELLGTITTDSDCPLSANLIAIQRKGEPFDPEALWGLRVCAEPSTIERPQPDDGPRARSK